MYEVYLITNTINGRQYVGAAKHGHVKRLSEHCRDAHKEHSNLHDDILKYGAEVFTTELLEDNISDEQWQEKERFYIAKYNTYYGDNPEGYNMTRGGLGTVGYKFTDRDRAKMSAAHKGCTFSPERNQYLREIMTGREYKQEWRDALSAARLGRFTKEENPFYGKHHTEEVKQFIRETNSGDHVLQIDASGNVVAEFFNLMDAGRWASENVSSARYTTCATRIREVCKSSNPKCTAYGYHWKLKESLSTNM